MNFLDWFFVVLPLVIVAIAGLYARRYVRSVADFMSANRSAGRYLLAIASGELQTGAVVFVGIFESLRVAGFTIGWWGWLSIPIMLIVRISGFVVYRYRETRALTLAQFFELRYNKSFRVATGVLAFIAGIFNFGIIPSIGARCLVYFMGLPESVSLGSISLPTYVPLMALFLSITVFVATSGGVLTVMVVNAVEGMLSQVFFLIIIVSLLMMFRWEQVVTALSHRPAGQSLINPFDTSGLRDFNLSFVIMNIVIGIYMTMSWQNAGGYNGAALTPHEGRMGNILGSLREMGKGTVILLMAVCAITYLDHPDFAAQSALVHAAVHQIADSQAQEQMLMPIAVAHLLPTGVKGIFCAILLMGIFGGDATHLHSWGSIFVQDVIVPLRKRPFGPKQHLFILRCSIVGVAIFAFLFGISFHQTEYISMWWSVTQSIFVGGAGAAIIGGLYWKKGTAAGAWVAFFTGSVLSTGGIIARQIYGNGFALNGTEISLIACLAAVTLYVIVSLLTCKEDFNLDRLLHRGEYAAIKPLVGDTLIVPHRSAWIGRIIGIDDNFTFGDKWIAWFTFSLTALNLILFVVGTAWNLISPWPLAVWGVFWHIIGVGMPIFLALLIGVWFTWGGLRDMRDLFARLRVQTINPLDDGTVFDQQNLDELIVEDHAHGVHSHDNLMPPAK